MMRIILSAAALSVGCGMGYWLGTSESHPTGLRKETAPTIENTFSAGVAQAPAPSSGILGTGENDTSGALAEIRQEPLESRRLAAIGRFCDRLDAAGARAAMDTLRDDPSGQSWELRKRVMSRWAELEPVAAAEYTLTIVDSHVRTSALHNVFEVWTHTDPEAAKKFFLGMQGSSTQSELISGFSLRLAERDPEGALRFVDTAPLVLKRDVIWSVFHHLAHINPSAAIARASSLENTDLREQATASTLAVWIEKDPRAALAWLERDSAAEGTFNSRSSEMLLRLVQDQPEIAMSYVLQLPPGGGRERMIGSLASSWAYNDPLSALAWAQKLPEGSERAHALKGVVSNWSSFEPAAAADFIAQQPADQIRETMLEDLGREWTRSDPEGALDWALSHPSPEVEKHVMSIALGRVAADNPARAVAALAQLQSPEGRKEATEAIGRKWIRKDPDAAMEWLLTFPYSDTQSSVVSQWTNDDPAAVAKWLNAKENHPKRESVLSTYVTILKHYEPEAAANWANTVKDPAARQRSVASTVEQMARYDAEAALRWISAQNFPVTEQKFLREKVESVTRRK